MVVALGNCAERIGGWGEPERKCAATHQGGAGSRDGPGQGVRLKGAIRVGRGRIRAHETDRSLERQEGLAQKQRREDADEACELAKIEKDGEAPVHDLRELGRRVRQATDDGPDELIIHDTHDARVRVPGGGARGSARQHSSITRDKINGFVSQRFCLRIFAQSLLAPFSSFHLADASPVPPNLSASVASPRPTRSPARAISLLHLCDIQIVRTNARHRARVVVGPLPDPPVPSTPTEEDRGASDGRLAPVRETLRRCERLRLYTLFPPLPRRDHARSSARIFLRVYERTLPVV